MQCSCTQFELHKTFWNKKIACQGINFGAGPALQRMSLAVGFYFKYFCPDFFFFFHGFGMLDVLLLVDIWKLCYIEAHEG